MKKTGICRSIYMTFVLLFACILAFSAASCAGKDEGGNAGDQGSGTSQTTDAAASQKKEKSSKAGSGRQKKLKLKHGKKIRIDKKGFVTRRSVYTLKAGTRLTHKELKKTGGVKRWFRIYKIKKNDRVYRRINGKSYRKNPVISYKDLRYITTLYYDFSGKLRTGEIIVNRSIAKDTEAVFRELFKEEYQIRRMTLIDKYYPKSGASGNEAGSAADTASMNDDNTAGFNYRMVAGTSTVSMHGYGRAIDVNPFENPWCPGGRIYPNQSRSAEYANRSVRKPHMIFADSDITRIFRKHGFRWLGETGTRDYQHFEK